MRRRRPGDTLSVATDIEHIALAEVRLLRRARGGDGEARADLLRPYEPGMWTLYSALYANAGEAHQAFSALHAKLDTALKGFIDEAPFGLQLYGLLWRELAGDLRPTDDEPQPIAHKGPLAKRTRAADRERVLAGLRRVDRYDALVWLFCVVTGLDLRRVAELTGASLPALAAARRRAAWSVHHALLT